MVALIKELGTFSAAHQLPNHNGLCKNLHGHNYKVIVSVVGEIKDAHASAPDGGMVIDFSVLKALYKEHIEAVCDHALLLGQHIPYWYKSLRQAYTIPTSTHVDIDHFVDDSLGKVAHLPIPETTAEWLAVWMHDTLNEALRAIEIESDDPYHVTVLWVQVWETPTSCAQSSR